MKKYFALIACLFWLTQALVPAPMLAASTESLTEEQVQAQIILNFPLFITWPAGAGPQEGKSVVCAMGDDPVSRAVEAMATNGTFSQTIVFRGNVTPEQAPHCQVLFIGDSQKTPLKDIFGAVSTAPVLTVSTVKNFSTRGGMVGFLSAEKNIGVFTGKQVRFEVNLERARKLGLTFDPLLLELAEKVVER